MKNRDLDQSQPDEIFLSFCIPTCNRVNLLKELLDSVTNQLPPGDLRKFEIVISDDGSKDGTADAVANYAAKWPGLFRWISTGKSIGYDKNILRLVSEARGQFCWLLSDDDALEPHALALVLSELVENPEIEGLTLGLNGYDRDLRNPIKIRSLTNGHTRTLKSLDDALPALIDLWGFLSSQVVKRKSWNESVHRTGNNLDMFCTGYIQMYIIGDILRSRPIWRLVTEPCIRWRSANDSFQRLGFLGRLKMEITSYLRILNHVCESNPQLLGRMVNHVAGSHLRHQIVTAKLSSPGMWYGLKAAFLCLRNFHQCPKFWTSSLPLLILPSTLIRVLRRIYQRNFR